MKRWGAMVAVAAAALGVIVPSARGADLLGYTFSFPISATGAYAGYHQYQIGTLNNKEQFAVDIINSADAAERAFVWDGTQLIRLSDSSLKLPDGSAFSTGNVWTPFGLNDNGTVAWVADTDGSVAGVKYVVTYDINTKQYSIVAKPGDPAPGGGSFGDDVNFGPTDRMLADINNKGQIVWNQGISGGDADGTEGVFMYDPATKQITAIARMGSMDSTGKALANAYWPSINDQGQVSFAANVQGADQYGIYVWDKGTITPIATPGTKVGDQTIAEARFANLGGAGDIVFVGDTGDAQGAEGEVTAGTGVFLYNASTKALQTIVKPGDALPGGSTWQGVENSRRVVEVNAHQQIAIAGIRNDDVGGIYLWQNGKLSALALDGDTLPGVGKVDGVVKGHGGVDGYHIALNDNGDVAFPASTGGAEGILLAKAPAAAAPAAAPAAAAPTAGY